MPLQPSPARPVSHRRTTTAGTLALALSTAFVLAVPADAQEGTLRLGETVTGSLTSDDPAGERGHYDDWMVEVGEAQTVVVAVTSPEFDTYLRLYSAGGGGMQEIASDDDGGEGLDSRIRHPLPGAGTYVVRVTSYAEGATGRYTLSLEDAPEVVITPPEPLVEGGSVAGALGPTDPTMDGSHYDDFVFEADAGSRVRIEVASDAFDTYLHVGQGEGDGFTSVASDDDGAGGLNSGLTWTVPSAGTWTARVTSYGSYEEGPYVISYRMMPEPVTADPEPYPGHAVEGVLEETDAQGETMGYGAEPGFYDEWTYQGRAGERLIVSLGSTAFDTYLRLGRGTGEQFEELKADDDGGANLNSLLAIVLPFDGTYTIRVSAIGEYDVGTYTLEVESNR